MSYTVCIDSFEIKKKIFESNEFRNMLYNIISKNSAYVNEKSTVYDLLSELQVMEMDADDEEYSICFDNPVYWKDMHDMFFDNLAPYVKEGTDIFFRDEYNEDWKYTYKGGANKRLDRAEIYGDRYVLTVNIIDAQVSNNGEPIRDFNGTGYLGVYEGSLNEVIEQAANKHGISADLIMAEKVV